MASPIFTASTTEDIKIPLFNCHITAFQIQQGLVSISFDLKFFTEERINISYSLIRHHITKELAIVHNKGMVYITFSLPEHIDVEVC